MRGWLVPANDDAAQTRNAAETVDMKEVFRLVAPDNAIRYEGGPPLVTQVRSLLPSCRKPVFGICLGHQILALAAERATPASCPTATAA